MQMKLRTRSHITHSMTVLAKQLTRITAFTSFTCVAICAWVCVLQWMHWIRGEWENSVKTSWKNMNFSFTIKPQENGAFTYTCANKCWAFTISHKCILRWMKGVLKYAKDWYGIPYNYSIHSGLEILARNRVATPADFCKQLKKREKFRF